MARNQTLEKILGDVRAEARLSSNVAHNIQTRHNHIQMIQREQDRLWEEFDWPFLRVERFILLQAGQRFYDPVSALNAAGASVGDMSLDRIEKVEVKSDGTWFPVQPGVYPQNYAAHDSALDQRAWPPRRWQVAEGNDGDETIEVWPVPDQNANPTDQYGYLKLTGIRRPRPLVSESDRADLDDRLLALFVAGALLAATQAADANIKLEAANRHYLKLKGNQSKVQRFSMFGTGERPRRRGSFVSHYKPPVS